ncbi:hypothetical protein BpHYR1_030036 [Brachionus plicatilis]|uniref:Uncharacterized protein n=1 Tax=Brachionus plicatilis TaxID=10195 RepID=A0A3M7S3M1_BRAPC|nr:hypothetical protein BpHYR1_030036 [Brachionus plicatilis]
MIAKHTATSLNKLLSTNAGSLYMNDKHSLNNELTIFELSSANLSRKSSELINASCDSMLPICGVTEPTH